jgi:co-chaperonin GroES (HSP10)
MPKFRPLQDYILIKPSQRSRSQTLTVITSETDQGSCGAYGEVMAVGPGKLSKRNKLIPVGSKVGDIVLYGGQGLGCIKFPKVMHNGEECLVIQDADVCYVEERTNHASN